MCLYFTLATFKLSKTLYQNNFSILFNTHLKVKCIWQLKETRWLLLQWACAGPIISHSIWSDLLPYSYDITDQYIIYIKYPSYYKIIYNWLCHIWIHIWQNNTIQYDTIWYDTIWYNRLQYNVHPPSNVWNIFAAHPQTSETLSCPLTPLHGYAIVLTCIFKVE